MDFLIIDSATAKEMGIEVGVLLLAFSLTLSASASRSSPQVPYPLFGGLRLRGGGDNRVPNARSAAGIQWTAITMMRAGGLERRLRGGLEASGRDMQDMAPRLFEEEDGGSSAMEVDDGVGVEEEVQDEENGPVGEERREAGQLMSPRVTLDEEGEAIQAAEFEGGGGSEQQGQTSAAESRERTAEEEEGEEEDEGEEGDNNESSLPEEEKLNLYDGVMGYVESWFNP